MRAFGPRTIVRAALLGSALLLAVATPAQVVRQLTEFKNDRLGIAAIDDAGATVFASSSADPAGTNPSHAFQVFKWSLPGAATQAGSLPGGIATSVSVTDDGLWLALVAPSDPLGLNHDGSQELFLQSADGTTLTQLTSHGADGGSVLDARISGSGNRVIFIANTDSLGTNPTNSEQLFAIDTDGTGLTQLISAGTGRVFRGFSVSDDGQRVAFGHDGDLTGNNPGGNRQVFRVEADGSNLFQLTASGTDGNGAPAISGSGVRIAYEIDGAIIRTVLWDGTADTFLAAGSNPSITDTGQWVFYEFYDGQNVEIYKAKAPAGVPIPLTSSTSLNNFRPVVSGGNSRVTFGVSGGAYPGGSNPDLGVELMVMDADGSNLQQLTNNALDRENWEPDVTPDGSRATFNGGAFGVYDIYRIETDGTELAQITSGVAGFHSSVASDGSTIVFQSWDDLTGNNSCQTGQIYRVQADGSGLMQLTPDDCSVDDHPVIARDGSVAVYQTNGAFLRSVPAGGGLPFEFVDDNNSLRKNPRVSHDGVWAVFHSQTTDGDNPDGSVEVYRARTDGTLYEQLTASPHGAAWPDISGDGRVVTYASSADPLGTNPEHNSEIFVYDTLTTTTQQLTVTTAGSSTHPRISGDGSFVYFASTTGFFGPVPGQPYDLYRVTVATGTIERAAGLRDPRGIFPVGSLRNNPAIAVDDSGGAVFWGFLDPTDENADLSTELWRVDFAATPRIDIDKTAPAALSWDPDPRAVRYDVVRGDVANLQPGPGGTVDLGPVVCLEDDSPDANTSGFEDTLQPVAGQVLFYVYRGTQGSLDGPGSWGVGLGGGERLPGSGGCAP